MRKVIELPDFTLKKGTIFTTMIHAEEGDVFIKWEIVNQIPFRKNYYMIKMISTKMEIKNA